MARPFRSLPALILLFSLEANASSVESFWYNSKGIGRLKMQQAYPAYQEFLKAMNVDPLNPVVQLNLAYTFQANEEMEKAEAAYRGALMLLPAETAHTARFQALFNLGEVYAKEQKIPEALSAYQEALSLEPQSKETKTMIELLWQGGGGQGKDGQDKDKNKSDKGKGQGQDQKDQKPDDKKDGKNKQDGNPKDDDKKNKQPRPFESQDLSKEDVKKILDEIKNQEQSIRAQEYERNVKEAPHGKDW